jgi:hypothetical protein
MVADHQGRQYQRAVTAPCFSGGNAATSQAAERTEITVRSGLAAGRLVCSRPPSRRSGLSEVRVPKEPNNPTVITHGPRPGGQTRHR